MEALAQANAKRMYSWWWDSHTSPKNSRWLQENLTDIDLKVKQMIKLLEEDADSFARKAEMYYKKRPELMKLVEEFYRAYRALAERYDNATGVLRQAHKAMAEALPNHSMLSDEPSPDFEPQTTEMSFSSRNGNFSGDSDFISGGKGSKQFNGVISGLGRARVQRVINFNDSEGKQVDRSDEEIASLKKDLARLEAEEEAGVLLYQQSLEELKKFSERAEQAEAEVRFIRESIKRLEEEKNESLLKYQECLEEIGTIENLMKEFNERANRVEAEVEALKEDLVRVEAEKGVALGKYTESLEIILGLEESLRIALAEVESLMEELAKLRATISDLEHKLAIAEEEAQRLKLEIGYRNEKLRVSGERSLMLENSNQSLLSQLDSQSRELAEKLTEVGTVWARVQEERPRLEEAETAFKALQRLHSQSEEELRSVAVEIQARDHILKDMEARNRSLNEIVEKMLDEKKNLKVVNLSSSITVKNLQEKISSLQEMMQKLHKEMELRVHERNALQQEIYCLKGEMNDLNEKNRCLIQQVDSEMGEKGLLLEKVAVMEKVIEKDLNLENLLSDLNDELEGVRKKVEELEDSCESLIREKDCVASQFNLVTQNIEKLEEKNNLLENSLCYANAEVEALRVRSKSLEDSCTTLGEEKLGLVTETENLVSQLDESQKRLKDLDERFRELEEIHAFVEKEKESIKLEMAELNKILSLERVENSSFVQSSEAQKRDMETQVLLLRKEAASRNNEYKEEFEKNMSSQTEIFILQNCMNELKEKFMFLSMDYQKLVESSDLSEEQISCLESKNLRQLVELKGLKNQLNELHLWLYDVFWFLKIDAQQNNVIDQQAVEKIIWKAKESSMEIFVLQYCVKEFKENISSLSLNCQMLVKVSQVLENKIALSEGENFEQQVALKALADHIHKLHSGLCEVFGALGIGTKYGLEQKPGMVRETVECIISKVKGLQISLSKVEEDLFSTIEKSVLATVLIHSEAEAVDLSAERTELCQNLSVWIEQLVLLQKELEMIVKTSEDLRSEVVEGICREEVMKSEMMILHARLTCTGSAFEKLRAERNAVIEEKRRLEEEIHLFLSKEVSYAINSVILEDVIRQNFVTLKELVWELEKVRSDNGNLKDKIVSLESCLGNIQTEKLELKGLLEKSLNELKSVNPVCEQLKSELNATKETVEQSDKKLSAATETIALIENKKLEMENELERKMETARTENRELTWLLGKSEYEVKSMILVIEQLNSELMARSETMKQLEKRLVEETETINAMEDKKREIEEEMESKLGVARAEKLALLGLLDKLENEVKNSVSSVNEKLNSEVTAMNERAEQLEKNLIEATEMISAFDQKKSELEKGQVEKLELESLLVASENKVKSVSADNEQLNYEMADKKEAKEKQICEAAETITAIGNMKLEIEEELKDVNEEYVSVYSELMVSEVLEMLFEEKIHETAEEMESTRESRFVEMEILEKKIGVLEGENEELNTKLAAHSLVFASLQDYVVSLESLINSDKQNKPDDQGLKDIQSVPGLEKRLRAIVMAVAERLRKTEGPSSSSLQEAAAAEGRLMTKDIMLDQVSECSSYGISRRGTLERDGDTVFEQWDTRKEAKHGKRKVGESCNYETHKEHRSLYPSADSLVDKLEITESLSDTRSNGGKSRVNVLERLDSDVQRLTNLQMTVDDLKRKVEAIEKKKKKGVILKAKGFEYDTVKGQLEEAESSMEKLFNTNRKLAKNLEGEPQENDAPGVSRRRMSEQARRGSEKIGKVQVELQRIQSMLLKIEDENESMWWSKKAANTSSKRILLRDYLYGGSSMRGHFRNDPRHKKATNFCACAPKVTD